MGLGPSSEPWRRRRGINAIRGTIPLSLLSNSRSGDFTGVLPLTTTGTPCALRRARACASVLVAAYRSDGGAENDAAVFHRTTWKVEATVPQSAADGVLVGTGLAKLVGLKSGGSTVILQTRTHKGAITLEVPITGALDSDRLSPADSLDRQELYIPLKQEFYAHSGMSRKRWTMGEVREFESGRRFPTRIEVEDHLKRDSRNILDFSEIEFGVELEEFSVRWLERK